MSLCVMTVTKFDHMELVMVEQKRERVSCQALVIGDGVHQIQEQLIVFVQKLHA